MKRTIILLLLLMLSNLFVYGQTADNNSSDCSNKDVENFSSRGIKLGMDFDGVISPFVVESKLKTVQYNSDKKLESEITLEKLEQFRQVQQENNFGTFFVGGIMPQDLNRFENVLSYDFGFTDGKLSFIRIIYDKPDWTNVEQFIQTLAKVSSLPKFEYWNSARVKCGEVEVTAQMISRFEGRKGQLEISKSFNETYRARRQEFENRNREKEINLFKP